MQAFVSSVYGGPEVLQLDTVPIPRPRAGEVVVRVHATSLNPLDWHMLRGEPWLARLGNGFRRRKHPGIGADLAGEVVAVGDGVTDLQVGDRVFGTGQGSFAQYAVAKPGNVARIPDGVSDADAAALPVAGITALQAVEAAAMEPGSRVLVVGASGGVGTLAVQLARAAGAVVTGVCSTGNLELVRGLGASEVVDYTAGGLDELHDSFDAIIDSIGSISTRRCKQLLRPGGVLVVVGGPDRGRLLGPMTHLAKVKLAFVTGGRRARPFLAKLDRAALEELGAHLVAGRLRAVVDRTVPLIQLPEALAYLETRRARGKVVVTVDQMGGPSGSGERHW
jgi:NADPH:quinone reductase-like Zn-dependent oxidoreductase